MRSIGPVSLACLTPLALGACAATPYASNGYVSSAPPIAQASQGRPLAMLPAAAGPVLAVNETTKPNAVVQTIVLGGSQINEGENKISVTALVPPDPTRGNDTEGNVKVAKPTDTSIQDELQAEFPDTRMRISMGFDRNAQGPFGHAVGRGPSGATCVYAWQWIGPDRPLTLLEGVTGDHQMPVSVRVRLCQPNRTETQVLDLVRQMIVYAPSTTAMVPALGMLAPGRDALAAARNGSILVQPAMQAAPAAYVAAAPAYAPMAAPVPAYASPTYLVPAASAAALGPNVGPGMDGPTYAPPPPPDAGPEAAADRHDVRREGRRRSSSRRRASSARPQPARRRPVAAQASPDPAIGSAIPSPADVIPASPAAPIDLPRAGPVTPASTVPVPN